MSLKPNNEQTEPFTKTNSDDLPEKNKVQKKGVYLRRK